MRGLAGTASLFAYVDIASLVPSPHPLRAVRTLVSEVLAEMDSDFADLYSAIGRPSIPPEQLLKALLLQVFYGIRSERQLVEQLNYNLLFRWFVGLGIDDAVWTPTVFTKNRDRLANGEIAAIFMNRLLTHRKVAPLLSDEHFSVDGTLIEAWASHKSFRPKGGGDQNGSGRDFRGEKRCNETHASVTDPDARLYKKGAGKESKLSYMGHALMENRNGIAVGGSVSHATGIAEREEAEKLMKEQMEKSPPAEGAEVTLGADKAYDVGAHIENLKEMGVTSHASQNDKRKGGSKISAEVAATEGYSRSVTIRKRIECIFGYGKQVGTLRKTKHRGIKAVTLDFMLNLIGYNLIRIPKLAAI